MENNFNIDSDEKQRILSLHENATRQQYLNVLTEAVTPVTYTLGGNVELENVKNKTQPELKLFKGTVFKLTNNQMVANTKYQFVDSLNGLVTVAYNNINTVNDADIPKFTHTGKVIYDCKTYKFTSDKSGAFQYFDENNSLGKILQSKCKTSQQGGGSNYVIQNPHTLMKGAIKIVKGDIASKAGDKVVIKRGNTLLTSLDCKTGKFNTRNGQVDADGGNLLRDTLKKKFCVSSAPSGGKVPGGKVPGGKVPIVIPTDIDLSQITKDLPPELQTVLTPPTVNGQPNTSNTPDFNQLLTQLQGLS